MKRIGTVSIAVAAFVAAVIVARPDANSRRMPRRRRAQPREVPRFEVDPSWPKLPAKWVWGQVSSVSRRRARSRVDTAAPAAPSGPTRKARAAPPVMEFDAAGNFVQGWGGPGEGYDWPEIEHGIYVDPKGFVWIGGNGKTDHHLLKFTKDGKFVMQIGQQGRRARATTTPRT